MRRPRLVRRLRRPAAWGRRHWLPLVGALAIILLGGWVAITQEGSNDRVDQLEAALLERDTTVSSVAQQAADQDAQRAAEINALRGQILAKGEEPVVPPAEPTSPGVQVVPGEQGRPGERGPGPTDTQVRAAVADYFAANPPQPGRTPTDVEVAAAVAAYCNARGGCRGPGGVPGAAGQDGQDGDTVVGPQGPAGAQGPGPTQEQVAAEVAAFCSTGACVGPTGPQGPAGQAAPTVVRRYGPVGPLGNRQRCDLVVVNGEEFENSCVAVPA